MRLVGEACSARAMFARLPPVFKPAEGADDGARSITAGGGMEGKATPRPGEWTLARTDSTDGWQAAVG